MATKDPIPEGWRPQPADFDRTYQIVGRFLFHWASLESKLNELIGKGLKLGGLNDIVVTANVQLRDKIHIANTLIGLQAKTDDWKEDAAGWIDKARELSLKRNTLVHCFFGPSPKGVYFHTYRAKGKIEVGSEHWRMSDFEARIDKIIRVDDALERIVKDITPPPLGFLGRFSYSDVRGLLAEPGAPRTGLLTAASRARRPAQESQGSDEPIPQSKTEMLADILADVKMPSPGLFGSFGRASAPEPEPAPKKPPRKRKAAKKKGG